MSTNRVKLLRSRKYNKTAANWEVTLIKSAFIHCSPAWQASGLTFHCPAPCFTPVVPSNYDRFSHPHGPFLYCTFFLMLQRNGGEKELRSRRPGRNNLFLTKRFLKENSMRFCKICKVNFFSVDPRGRTIVSHRQEADKHGAQGLPKVQGQKKKWMDAEYWLYHRFMQVQCSLFCLLFHQNT